MPQVSNPWLHITVILEKNGLFDRYICIMVLWFDQWGARGKL